MTLNRQILRMIDDRLRSESDQEKGEWMAKVPISGATKAVWQRYCQAVGVHMGQGVAILIHHELASVVEEDIETLGDRLNTRQADLDASASDLAKAEKELERRQRKLMIRAAELGERHRDLEERESNAAVVEHQLAQQLIGAAKSQPTLRSKPKLGRNELCWCGSGKKYKVCHLQQDG
jgi:preprotein translocase subunit SecA